MSLLFLNATGLTKVFDNFNSISETKYTLEIATNLEFILSSIFLVNTDPKTKEPTSSFASFVKAPVFSVL